MGVNFGIEYLYASVAIESPGGLPNKASFVKLESSGKLISNLTKSPLFIFPPCLRGDNSCLSCRRQIRLWREKHLKYVAPKKIAIEKAHNSSVY